MVTGSVAAMAYGEPRLTNDIDVVVDLRETHVKGIVAGFPPGEFYISEEMVRQAIRDRSQFNVIHPASGLKVDMIVPSTTDFDRSRFKRVRKIRPSERYEANFAALEDVI